jgi:hypothetical protein
MGFKTREVLSFFSKHLKQNITFLEFGIRLFFHYFVAFENNKDIVDC